MMNLFMCNIRDMFKKELLNSNIETIHEETCLFCLITQNGDEPFSVLNFDPKRLIRHLRCGSAGNSTDYQIIFHCQFFLP